MSWFTVGILIVSVKVLGMHVQALLERLRWYFFRKRICCVVLSHCTPHTCTVAQGTTAPGQLIWAELTSAGRVVTSSWAYTCHVALGNVLSAAFWCSAGVFQNNYLRDLTPIASEMSNLGPVLAVQHVLNARVFRHFTHLWFLHYHAYTITEHE